MWSSQKESGVEQKALADLGWRRDELNLAVHGGWNEEDRNIWNIITIIT